MAPTISQSLSTMVYNTKWSEDAACLGLDTNLFFDNYEEDKVLASITDGLCSTCPIQRECLTLGVSRKEWGVWGGIYLEEGEISEEFNQHKASQDWSDLWMRLTTLTK